jgi:hypothetical protein
VLLVPNQTGDKYVMIGRISDLYNSVVHSCLRSVFLFMRGYSLNRRVYALFKILLMCVFQFKRVSRYKPRYLIGVSPGVQVICVLLIKMLGMFWCNLRRVNILASLLVVFSVNFHLLYKLVSSVIQVCRCVMAVFKSECCVDVVVSSA